MKRVSDALKPLIDNLNNGELDKFYKFYRSWEDIVGDDIAKFSRVKDLIKGSAIIEVDHSAGMNLMQMDKENILIKLKKVYPELFIKKVNFVLKKDKKIEENYKFKKILEKDDSSIEEKDFKKMLSRFNKLGD